MKVGARTLAALSEYRKWKEGARNSSFSLLDFACCVGTPDILFAFAELFSPELVLHEGAYFISSKFDEGAYEAWKSRGTDAREIQRVMNHIHMASILQQGDVPTEVLEEAAGVIASMWTQSFRSSGLVGEVVDEGPDVAVTLVSR